MGSLPKYLGNLSLANLEENMGRLLSSRSRICPFHEFSLHSKAWLAMGSCFGNMAYEILLIATSN